MSEDSAFCTQCGAPTTNAYKVCEKCGVQYPKDYKACPK